MFDMYSLVPFRCTWAAATAAAAAAAVVDVALGPVGIESGDILSWATVRRIPVGLLLLLHRPSRSAGVGLRNGLFDRLQCSLRLLFCGAEKGGRLS